MPDDYYLFTVTSRPCCGRGAIAMTAADALT